MPRLADPNRSMSKGYSERGADMGRADLVDDGRDWSGPVKLVQMRMSADGCYDRGGAYWGMGGPASGRMWIADGPGFRAYVRATDRANAKRKLLAKYPGVCFHR